MKLAFDNETLAENKALILYLLDKVNKPISNTALLKLISSINNMNYFYFQQFLLDLLENKYIVSYCENKETIYKLTPEGKQALELVTDIIPGFLKFKVDNYFKESLHEIENELSITSDFVPDNTSGFTVKCNLIENNKLIFEVQSFVTTREQAKFISDNWEKHADEIYPKILDILTKKR